MIRVMLSGYEHFQVGKTSVLAATPIAEDVRAVLQEGPLYEYAARVPEAAVLYGRAPVYIIPFGPERVRVAVRRVMRGGAIARLLKDRFLPPTRVLRELLASIRLRLAGVSTPDVLAVVTYPAGGPFRRADVMTRYVEGADLAAVFADERNDAQRRPILDAVAALLTQLSVAGVQHQDLNLKNILLTAGETGYKAVLLDVDRVYFHAPRDPLVARANLERVTGSLNKWRARPGARATALSEDDINYLIAAARPAE